MIFTTLVGVVFVMIYALSVHWVIAPAFLLTVPLLGTLSSVLSGRIKTIQKVIVAETTALAGSTTESLRNIELVKSLGLADQEVVRLNATTREDPQARAEEGQVHPQPELHPGHVGQPAAHVHSVHDAVPDLHAEDHGRAVLLAAHLFVLHLRTDAGAGEHHQRRIRETEVSLANFRKILDTPKDPKPAAPVPIGDIRNLEFENVGFMHQTASTPALTDISFSVAARRDDRIRRSVGRGEDDAGQAAGRALSAEGGRDSVQRSAEHRVDLDRLRERIGFVTQDAQLFSGTIRENLKFVNPHATDEECLDVLHKSAADTLLARADKGLDTVIGEGGVKVSGGEKQRLSIARALLRNPHLLVFDEATSSLDSLTEEEISRTMRDVANSREVITILIAHRLSTVMHADRIYVLERGKIVEAGQHEDLLERTGLYYAMWRQQVGERRTVPQLPSGKPPQLAPV